HPVIFESAPGEAATLCGGAPITGWTRGEKGIWSAPIPAQRGSPWVFRQLYVNGQLRTRARTPNSGFHLVAGYPDGGPEVPYQTPSRRFQYAEGDIDPSWRNLRDVELIVYHFLNEVHLRIDSVDPAGHIVTFQ